MAAFHVALLCWTPQARSSAHAETFMASVANPHAARAAAQIMRQGGNAVDAAVTAQLVLSLVEPQSSGIGGGAFMLHYDAASGDIAAYDGRETTPRVATEEMFLREDGSPMKFFEAVVGGRSVGAPGVMRMLELAHQQHGHLPWATLFHPAIELANTGFEISPRLHMLITRDQHLATQENARRYFYHADGSARRIGEVRRNPEYANVLRAIAAGGADAFYRGPLARDIVRAVRSAANPGFLSEEDLADYRAVRREAICGAYRAFRVCGMPPPTSGGVTMLQILGILDNHDVGTLAPDSAAAVHLISEASRLAYADRALYLADPDFVHVPVKALLDRNYLRARASLIDPRRSMGKANPGRINVREGRLRSPGRSLDLPSTTHFSIVDADGNAVSMTSSVENAFGSRLMVRGFMLNNQLTDFSFRPTVDGRDVANKVEPGKRPRSSMSPALVFGPDGNLRFVLGSPGGSRIIAYVTKTIIGLVDWQLNPQEAVSLPHHVNRNGTTDLEAETSLIDLKNELENMGHNIKLRGLVSGLHAVEVTGQRLMGGADPRREGIAIGD
ncbi:MAG: gamma-glutamyltransferase [Alphaproteobacteria bacterium]|nr:gamma-glutamyltransferase [Alphaproteobacteria bacterium]